MLGKILSTIKYIVPSEILAFIPGIKIGFFLLFVKKKVVLKEVRL